MSEPLLSYPTQNYQPSPPEAAQELLRRRAAREKLIDFTKFTFPEYQVGRVHQFVCEQLDIFLSEVLAGLEPRLLLFMPPRHGKSELVSRRLPAFALGKCPDLSIIATSYGADLASRMNRDVQRIMGGDEYSQLFPDSTLFDKNVRTLADGQYLRNSDIFEVVNHRGVYRSAGVGGGITGMGFDIGIMDDPIKDAEQAYSKTYRDKLWEWYLQVFMTRAMPGAGIIGMWTRWHADDLGGRMMRAMAKGGDQWKIIALPAIAKEDDVLGRTQGEALWPGTKAQPWFPTDRLMRIKNSPGGEGAGSRAFEALYQQSPELEGGNIFKREWWQYYRELPKISRVLQSWDTGFKEKTSADFSCCTTWGVAGNGYYLMNVWKGKVEFPELKTMARALAEKYTPNEILIEDCASGQSLGQELKRGTKLPIIMITVDRDKQARAHATTPLIESGKVYLPEPGTPGTAWLADYLDSLSAFPSAPHDDDVDSTTQALNRFLRGSASRGLFDYYQSLHLEQEAARAAGH